MCLALVGFGVWWNSSDGIVRNHFHSCKFLLVQNNNDLMQQNSSALDMQTQLLLGFIFLYPFLKKKPKKNIDNSYICDIIYILYLAYKMCYY